MPADLARTNEEAFHDGWADQLDAGDIMVDEFFEACTSPENRRILRELGDIRGRRVLDLGCGAGEASVYLAKKGADVTAADLSGGMLRLVQRVADRHGVTVRTAQCPSDRLPFPDETFDVVYAANLLHHVDIEATVREVRRVIKSGGRFVSWDPVAYNPAINLYRRKASGVRTADEHPLRIRDLRTVRDIFGEVRTHATWFFTLWIFMRFYLIERVDPNKERYWKKILKEHARLEKSYRRLERLDRALLSVLPFMKWWCWNMVILCRK